MNQGSIQSGEKVNFVVPTGNFGNILAAYYAYRMGLPIHRLLCASNSNNVLTDFLQTGCYDRKRSFHKTLSPSMDILISSNLERLLYHATGGNAKQVAQWMQELSGEGSYMIDTVLLTELQQLFWSGWVDDSQTGETIRQVYEEYNYTCDPHTAVAWRVWEDYQRETGDKRQAVIVSTASPFKFNTAVLSALGKAPEGTDEFVVLEELSKRIDWPVPAPLAALQYKPVRHSAVCAKEAMDMYVKQVLLGK